MSTVVDWLRPERKDSAELLESARARLREAYALLQAIDDGGLLSELPTPPAARQAHQCAVSMLAVLRRELEGIVTDLDAATQTTEVLDRVSRRNGH